jgi:hypothetical protein
MVRLQPYGDAHNRTIAKNALVEYNDLIFGMYQVAFHLKLIQKMIAKLVYIINI